MLVTIVLVELQVQPVNKMLNFVPATNSMASTGLPTLRCGSQLAKRYKAIYNQVVLMDER